MMDTRRALASKWVGAYNEYRRILPLAVDLDAPGAAALLEAHAKADWAAIDRAWKKVKVAQRAYQDSFRVGDDRLAIGNR